MAMTLEEWKLEKERKAKLKDITRTVEIQMDAYPVEDFKVAIQAYEDMPEWMLGIAYELAFPDRIVSVVVRGNTFIEVYYEERTGTEKLEG